MSSPIANAYREVAAILAEHRNEVRKLARELNEHGLHFDRAESTSANAWLADEFSRLGLETSEIADRMSDDIDAIQDAAKVIEGPNDLENIPPWVDPTHVSQEATGQSELFSSAIANP